MGQPMSDLPIVCTLAPAELEGRRRGLLAELVARAEERRLTEEGAVLVFAGEPGVGALVTQAIEAERACCRFLRFELTFAEDLGPITVAITGPAGTRDFLQDLLDL